MRGHLLPRELPSPATGPNGRPCPDPENPAPEVAGPRTRPRTAGRGRVAPPIPRARVRPSAFLLSLQRGSAITLGRGIARCKFEAPPEETLPGNGHCTVVQAPDCGAVSGRRAGGRRCGGWLIAIWCCAWGSVSAAVLERLGLPGFVLKLLFFHFFRRCFGGASAAAAGEDILSEGIDVERERGRGEGDEPGVCAGREDCRVSEGGGAGARQRRQERCEGGSE
jgi:hypothetical protein